MIESKDGNEESYEIIDSVRAFMIHRGGGKKTLCRINTKETREGWCTMEKEKKNYTTAVVAPINSYASSRTLSLPLSIPTFCNPSVRTVLSILQPFRTNCTDSFLVMSIFQPC
eukprot:TRINITY_DN7300_c0_g2_i2.p1 TRINITY_DN7300_c0_g2~~TRINITY_DN7300_c0_g2_i2.p1  ORF type:complete len:113 (+),score=2.13 TRINITY_DN7300_c0_g2_i2:476-814(+)